MYTGPNVTNDDLVFGYDTGYSVADNTTATRFYPGEPTTNVLTTGNASTTSGWGVSNTGSTTGTRTFLVEDGIPFMRLNNVTYVSGYPRFTGSVFANSATVTGSFSTSFEARGTTGASLKLKIYQNGSTKITNTATLTDKWTRYTFDNQSTSYNLNQPYFNPNTTGATYDIRNVQIEAKSHSTPFVSGSRSNTASLIDLKETEAINFVNMSFDSTGQPEFDGTDDYIDLGSDVAISPINQGWTAEYVFNSDDASVLQHFNGAEEDTHNANWLALLSSYMAVWDHGAGVWKYGSTQFSDNTWYHIAFVQETGTSMQFYVNGVAEGGNHASFSWSANRSALKCRYIGMYEHNGGYSRRFNGHIPIARLYNAPLTAAQIKQNYNAYKKRFNI